MPDLSYAVVEAPRVPPPRHSLLASAEEVTDGVRWQTGLAWAPPACDIGNGNGNGEGLGYGPVLQAFLDRCEFRDNYTGTAPELEEKELYDPPEIEEYVPYVLHYGDRCSAALFQSRDYAGYAADAYASAESAAMARELWTGQTAQAASLPNRYLADGNALDLSGGFVFPTAQALGVLQWFGGEIRTGRKMIHAARDVASQWFMAGLIYRQGNLLLDAYDNIVIADEGYPGTDANGDRGPYNSTVYMTDMVQVRRDGQIQLLPDRNDIGSALDRDTNTVEWRAERMVAAYYSGCVHVSIEVDVCETECPDFG